MQVSKDLLDAVIHIAQQAGKAAMTIYDKDFAIEYKGDESPVTDADLAAHKVIVKGLKELTPDTPILSEESASISWQERQTWNLYWLVDPIDGTKEFIKKNGEFTVNIALIEHGKPVLGVVDAPAIATTYFAALGIGSFKQQNNLLSELVCTQKPQPNVVKVVGSRSHPSPELADFIAQFNQVEMCPKGSSLKLCMVAEGSADIYPRLGPTSEWDTGAGHAVAEIAGASVCLQNGTPLLYNQKESYLNPYFIVSSIPYQ